MIDHGFSNSGELGHVPTGWDVKTINDLCSRVTSGGTPSRSNPSFYANGIIPWYKTKELKGWYIAEAEEWITQEALDKSSAKLFPKETVLMAMYGDGRTITSVGILPQSAATNQACCAMITDPALCDNHFLLYALKYHREDFLLLASGGSQRNLNTGLIKNFAIKVPPIEEQKKISAVLSAYDDLIENNTRRIQLLEQMAQTVYREWFVHFRFPGHETTPMIETPHGSIPQGWKTVNLKQVTSKIGSGATPTGGKKAYKSSGISLVRSLNVYDYHFAFDGLAFIDEQQAEKLSNVTLQKHDVLLNITGASVARCCMVPSYILPARVNQHVSIIRADNKKLTPFYLLYLVNNYESKNRLLSIAQGGATREAITKRAIQNFNILLPPMKLQKQFDEIIHPSYQLKENLEQKNANLRQTRDMLLPRLISGELDVSQLDIQGVGDIKEVAL